ncbi:MAG: purC [Caloramator sp.]|uniref:phosphoribosylaminoimidazolesuccinocarboxamide synthase n=1 Tax=Caloramator sp. TaxID=1871330 RepID=UPI001D769566|nr:phosphoribosylaminoimidazolesuccinocarboxamide synthase [Caloramator sp.]MBZ4664238.1 purC [Caloramator sp.]
MEKLNMLYEGKAKKVYETNEVDKLIVYYKDDATAFNGLKKDVILDKGILNNSISSIIFKKLQENNIKTHFIEKLSDREQLVKKVSIVPLEVIVRNYAAGSIVKRLGLKEGQKFNEPILEISYKNDSLQDPLINDYHAIALGLVERNELINIYDTALKINSLLTNMFEEIGIILIDFKLEFGRKRHEVILADEISPDTCRLWDKETLYKYDKDRFRQDLGNVIEGYREILKRLEELR